jgi:hypothetical protein
MSTRATDFEEATMATIELDGTMRGVGVGILDRERTIATAGFNRWLVPPAALCIHLCIGMAYGFSVFWLPLSRAIGLTATKIGIRRWLPRCGLGGPWEITRAQRFLKSCGRALASRQEFSLVSAMFALKAVREQASRLWAH